ncbi:MAG: type II secretion system F family protein [Candidatus Methanoperedens sp.]|nr:type II secretion system F family protein [Candidatus Methanoperedens sp.]
MFKKAFECMNMTQRQYIMKFALPLLFMGLFFPLAMFLLVPDLVAGAITYVLLLVPFLFVGLIIFYPLSILGSKKIQIDQNMHYYITHMGVLAASNMARREVIHHLSMHPAYGYLATETGKIYSLMNDWNFSLAQACRFMSKRTPSAIFADFLDRLAHSSEAGEPFDQFVWTEQKVVMNEFDTMYKKSLSEIQMTKEIFVAMMTALIFLTSISLIMPIITGMDPIILMVGSIVTFLGAEAVLVNIMKSKAPKDKIWHTLKIETGADRLIRMSFPVSIIGVAILSVIMLLLGDMLPVTIKIAIALTPLLITGYYARREEELIKRKDDNFSAFVRALGSTAGARGGIVRESLRNLTYHDFGPLTPDIKELYKHLETSINKSMSWNYFSAGAGSNLIERFASIFAEGIDKGGKPEVIGEIIGDNFMHIISLRKLRYSLAGSLVGETYGLTGGIAFTMFLTLAIVKMMINIFEGSDIPPGMTSIMALGNVVDINFLALLLMSMMVGHSLLSALLIRSVDGGSLFNCYIHFVGMVWLSAIAAEISFAAMVNML